MAQGGGPRVTLGMIRGAAAREGTGPQWPLAGGPCVSAHPVCVRGYVGVCLSPGWLSLLLPCGLCPMCVPPHVLLCLPQELMCTLRTEQAVLPLAELGPNIGTIGTGVDSVVLSKVVVVPPLGLLAVVRGWWRRSI